MAFSSFSGFINTEPIGCK